MQSSNCLPSCWFSMKMMYNGSLTNKIPSQKTRLYICEVQIIGKKYSIIISRPVSLIMRAEMHYRHYLGCRCSFLYFCLHNALSGMILYSWIFHSNSSSLFPPVPILISGSGFWSRVLGCAGMCLRCRISLITHHSYGSYKPLELLHGLSRFPLDLICSWTAPVC